MALRRSHLGLSALVLCLGLFVLVPSAMAADAGLIAFEGIRREAKDIKRGVFTMNPDGSGVRRLGDGVQPAISRDGKKIAFAKETGTGSEIYTMSAGGGDVKQITDDGATDTEPAFSPDGKRIAFVGSRIVDGPSGALILRIEIYVVDADGSDERQLTKGPGLDVEPSFSPDGKRIVFVRRGSQADASKRLATMTAGGADVTVFDKFDYPFSAPASPSFSPDGRRILFGAAENKRNRIYTFDSDDGSDLDRLPYLAGVEPAYAPNGRAIVFRGGDNLLTMMTDGSGLDRLSELAPDEGTNADPSWGR